MVVRRRSKSCATCLRRRKGCDQQRPSCGQCRKACLSCEGYHEGHGLIFVNTSTAVAKDGAITRQRVTRFKSATPPMPSSRLVALNDTLAAGAVEAGQIDSFWRAYMPHARDLPADVARNVMGAWLLPAQRICRSGDPMMHKIMLSLALAAAEGPGNVEEMRAYGFQLYSEALAEVSAALLTPKRAHSDEILVAVKLFSLYESHYGSRDSPFTLGQPDMSVPAQARNWLSHVDGHISMILSRSPESFIDGVAHSFFVDARCHLVFSSLVARKPTPFASPAWKTVPWANHPKTPRDHVVDIFADITCVVGSINELALIPEMVEFETQYTHLMSICMAVDQRLHIWEDQFGRNIERSLPRQVVDVQRTGSTTSCFTVQELAATRLMTIYWMTGMVLGQALQDLRATEEVFLGQTGSHTPVPLHTDTEESFRRLIAAFPIFFEPAAGEFRMNLAATPMTLAMRHLEYLRSDDQFDREKAMIARCLGTPQGKKVRLMVLSFMQV